MEQKWAPSGLCGCVNEQCLGSGRSEQAKAEFVLKWSWVGQDSTKASLVRTSKLAQDGSATAEIPNIPQVPQQRWTRCSVATNTF